MTAAQSTALVSLMDRLSRAVSVDEIARVIVDGGGEALGANGDLRVLVWDDEHEHLELLSSRTGAREQHEEPGHLQRPPGSEPLPTTYTALTGEPLWFESREEYLSRYPCGADLVGNDAEAVAMLPLSTRERTFGTVAIQWTEARSFSQEERTYAMTLCRIFAQALDRGRLVEEQRVARERAESNERRSRLLAEASALLTMSLVEDEIFRRAAEIAVPAFADWCVVDVLDEDDGGPRRALVHHRDRARADIAKRLLALPPAAHEATWVRRAMSDVESQLVESVSPAELELRSSSPEARRLAEELGLGSFIVIPLVVRGRVEGTLSFVRGRDAAPYVSDDVALAEDLTHRTSLAVENARLFHTERRHAQDVHRLQRISEGLTVAVTPDDVANVVVSHGVPATAAVRGVLVLYDERRGCFGVIGERDRSEAPGDAWGEYPLEPPTPLGDAILRGEPVILESLEQWLRDYPSAGDDTPLGSPGARVVLPLLAGDKVLGALGFSYLGHRRFSDEERDFLVAVARQCALALERARLYAAQAKAREQTLVLLRLTSGLALAQTTAEVASAVVDDVIPVLGCESGYLALLDPDGLTVRVRFSDGKQQPQPGEWFKLNPRARSPVADVLASGQPLFFEDGGGYASAYPAIRDVTALDLQASALLPISVGGRRVGALGLRYPMPRRFDEDTTQLLEAVSIQCGDAFERAELLGREAEARRGAEVANRAKDEFLAMLGHELRNPLMPIVTALSLMRIKGDEHFVKERAMIERQAQHLLRLVDDLLDVSRIARGKIDLRRKRTDLAAIVGQAMETTSPLFEQRHHELQADLADDLLVEGDAGRLVQVVANLLSNAAKYTEPGGRVDVKGRVEGDEVVLRVKDTGVGIDKQLLPRVFDLFVQGARGIDRAQGGLGLGLSLVKSITVLHGGTLDVHSEGPGKGSEFVVRLPRALMKAEDVGLEPSSDAVVETPSRAPLRILVVDDNVDAADSLAETLQELGHKTAVAYDGPQGLARARALDPEVALLDIGLPVMDGYELARTLQKEHGRDMTLVAVTGYGQPADRARAKDAGFDHHFVKPIHLAGLLALLQRIGAELHPT